MYKYYLILVLIAPVTSLAEPKDYQRLLISEPVSLLDLMIYKNSLRFNLEKNGKTFIDTSESGKDLMKSFPYYGNAKREEFEWQGSLSEQYTFRPPITISQRDVKFNYPLGKFEVSIDMSWEWYINSHNELKKQKGRMKASQVNMARLCIIQLKRISEFLLQAEGHQGYTSSSMPKNEDFLIFKVIQDTYYKVKIHAFGSTTFEDQSTYLTCQTNQKHLSQDKVAGNVEFSFIGKWDELDALAKTLK